MHGFVLLYGSITFFGSDRLLLATSSGIYLYQVPSLESMLEKAHHSQGAELTDVSPSWSTCGAWAMSTPLLSPPILHGGARPRACCTVWTGHDVHTLDVPLHETASGEDKVGYFVARINQRFTHQTMQSVSHGLALHRHRSADSPSVLVSIAVDSPSENGFVRLGRERSLVRQGSLKWEPGCCVVDISVDEVSGKIAVLDCDEKDNSSGRRLKIYSTLS